MMTMYFHVSTPRLSADMWPESATYPPDGSSDPAAGVRALVTSTAGPTADPPCE